MTIEELKENGRPHLSYSQISTYLKCPLKYYFQYIEKVEFSWVPDFIVFGWAIHSALHCFYQQGILEGNKLTVDDLFKTFRDCWKHEEKKAEIQFNGGDKEDAMKMGKSLLEVYLEKTKPQHVIGVEEP